MKIRLYPLILLILANACGGEVHFVTDKPNAPPVPLSTPARAKITEAFRYGLPNGNPSVAFALFPRKSLQKSVQNLNESIQIFAQEIADHSSGFQSIQYIVAPSSQWYSTLNPQAALVYFADALSAFSFNGGGSEGSPPFALLAELAEGAALQLAPESSNAWLHVIYIRDNDLILPQLENAGDSSNNPLDLMKQLTQKINPLDPKKLELDLQIAVYEQAQKDYAKKIGVQPLSPFRSSLSVVSYQSVETPCNPLSSRVGKKLGGYFKEMKPSTHELCDLEGKDEIKHSDLMRSLARRVLEQQQRIVLRKKPNLETLEIKTGTRSIARENIEFKTDVNEIVFKTSTASQINSGDPVTVTYEAAE